MLVGDFFPFPFPFHTIPNSQHSDPDPSPQQGDPHTDYNDRNHTYQPQDKDRRLDVHTRQDACSDDGRSGAKECGESGMMEESGDGFGGGVHFEGWRDDDDGGGWVSFEDG